MININKYKSPFFKIAAREINRISERKTIYFISIILPIILFLLFAMIYKNGSLRDLPIAVYDEDNSELSRLVIRSIDATASIKVAEYSQSVDDIKDKFRKGIIQGALYIPKNLEENLKGGKETTVILFKNTSSLIVGNSILKDGSTAIRTLSAGILLKKLRSKGLGYEKAMTIANPIKVEAHPLYNTTYNYESYLIPGLIFAVLQMIIMVVSVLLISSEFTHNTFPELLEISNNRIAIILFGKAFPHLLIHIAIVLGVFGIIFPLFSINITGQVIGTIIFAIYFVITVFFFGILISSVFHNQLFATEVALFVNTPAFIFSGFTFPLWGMPALHNYFAQLIPCTHFMTGFLKIYQMGAPFKYVIPEFSRLSVFLVVSIIGSLFALRYQIKKYYSKDSTDVLEKV